MELLEALPDTPERAPQEVVLQTMLGQSFLQIRGYGAPEVQQALSRARDLIGQIGESPQHLQVMSGLHDYYWIRGEHQSARTISEQILEVAQISKDPDQIQIAHRRLGSIMLFMGDLRHADEQLTQGIARYDLEQHRSLAMIYG